MARSLRFRKRLFLAEVWLRLAFARFLIKYVPFRRWKKLLGPIDGAPEATVWPELSEARLKQAAAIGRDVDWVANRAKLFEAVCLPRAMAGRWALARRGLPSRIVIGSRRGEAEEGLLFHAWLLVGDRTITGGQEQQQFLEFRKRRDEVAGKEAAGNAG